MDTLRRSGQRGVPTPVPDWMPSDLRREMTRQVSCQCAEFRPYHVLNSLQFHRKELLHWHLCEGVDVLELTESERSVMACEAGSTARQETFKGDAKNFTTKLRRKALLPRFTGEDADEPELTESEGNRIDLSGSRDSAPLPAAAARAPPPPEASRAARRSASGTS